jgi:hypothetical protein
MLPPLPPLLLLLLLLLQLPAPHCAQPFAPLLLFGGGSAPLFSPDGATLAPLAFPANASAGAQWAVAAASSDGRTALVVGQDPARGGYFLRTWNRSSLAFVDTAAGSGALGLAGLPPVGSLYLADVGLSKVAWLAGTDAATGAGRMFFRNPTREQKLGSNTDLSSLPLVEVPVAAAPECTQPLRWLTALPDGGALGILAAAPYSLVLWPGAEGCAGALNALAALGLAGAGLQVNGAAIVSTGSFFSYTIALALGPEGGAGGAVLAAASPPAGLVLSATVLAPVNTSRGLLVGGAWSAAPLPPGVGATLLVAAPMQGAGGSTALALTGYFAAGGVPAAGAPLALPVASLHSSWGAAGGGAWAAAGPLPIIPLAAAATDALTLHVVGRTLAPAAAALAYTANGGASWRVLSPSRGYPGPPALGVGAPHAALLRLASRGGPVLLSGMDPTNHGSYSIAGVAGGPWGSGGSFPLGPYTYGAPCDSVIPSGSSNWMRTSLSVLEGGAVRGARGSIAVLGVVPSAAAFGGAALATYLALCKNGYLGSATTFWGSAAAWPTGSNGTIDAFFSALAWGDVQPRVIFIGDARSPNGVGVNVNVITAADQALVDAHATALGKFVTSGGAVLSNSQYDGVGGGDH